MNRHHIVKLKSWYTKSGRLPLILRGARQVGKSTLIRLFAQAEKLDLLEINLERGLIKSVEKEDIVLNEVLDEIQLRTQKRLSTNSLIFFDEIQEQPKLLKFLRYFYEERPELAVICAGSLLEIILNEESFSFPVGRVEFQYLGPMTFTEFLVANGQEYLAEKILAGDLKGPVHEAASLELQKYFYIGGMPQAVKTYIQTKSLIEVRAVQEQILQTYIADFPKYNRRINVSRIQRIFASMVGQLGQKIIYSRLDENSQARDTRRVVELLVDAKVLLSCLHTDGTLIPLAATTDSQIQKIYFLDVGLVNCMQRLDLQTIDSEFKNNFANKGVIAEQFVAQHLAYLRSPSMPPELFYWLRDKGIQKSEIDFLIENDQKIIPVEVKFSKTGHLKSLMYFIKEKRKTLAVKLSLEPAGSEQFTVTLDGTNLDCHLEKIPLWAIESLYKILESKK